MKKTRSKNLVTLSLLNKFYLLRYFVKVFSFYTDLRYTYGTRSGKLPGVQSIPYRYVSPSQKLTYFFIFQNHFLSKHSIHDNISSQVRISQGPVQIAEDQVQIDRNVPEEYEAALSDLSDDSLPDELEEEELEKESYIFLK